MSKRKKRNKPPSDKQDNTLNTFSVGSSDLQKHDATHHKDSPEKGEKEQQPMKGIIKRWWTHLGDAHNSNRIVAIFTIVIALTGIVYACFANKQWHVMRQAFIAANMPSVGVNMLHVRHLYFDEKGNPIQNESRTEKTVSLGFIAEIKNFGQVTADNFTASWKGFLDGSEQPVQPAPIKPARIFPGRTINLVGQIMSLPDYVAVVTGKEKLVLDITVRYDDPERHRVEYCERDEYDYRINAFANLGACP